MSDSLPTDLMLRDFLDGRLSEIHQREIEVWIDQSPEAKVRLELLLQKGGFGFSSEEIRNALPFSSESLALAMESLKREFAMVPFQGTSSEELARQVHGIEFVKLIGHGGMGVVYQGRDLSLGRFVAIKVLLPDKLHDSIASERLLREAQTAAQLQHENIVAIHSIQQIQNIPILIQQFVPGESLQQYLDREGKLPQPRLIELAVQIARGLSAAHRRGVTHRDLKPDNILLDDDAGLARIADFGLAKQKSLSSLTQEGVLAGTPAYMSPEQAKGEKLDGRSDLFSLGVVLYLAATGTMPFQADNPYVLLDKIQHQAAKPLRTYRPDLSVWFCELVDQLLAKRRDRRVESADQMICILESQTRPSRAFPFSVYHWTALAVIGLLVAGTVSLFLRKDLNPVDESNKSSLEKSLDEAMPNIEGVQSNAGNTITIVGSQETFTSLGSAVNAASDGSTIRLHGNGPFFEDSIVIHGKRLIIEGMEGSVPEIRSSLIPANTPLQFITTNSDLQLKGLEIKWSAHSPPIQELFGCEAAVISSANGRLLIDRCHVQRTPGGICVGISGGTLQVSQCHIEGAAVSIALFAFDESVEISQSLLSGKTALAAASPNASIESDKTASLTLKHTSIVSDCLVQLFLFRQPRPPIKLDLSDCVFDCHSILQFTTLSTLKRDLFAPIALTEMASDSIRCSEQRCIYRIPTSFVTSRRMRQLNRVFDSSIDNLGEWRSMWSKVPSGSIEAGIDSSWINVSRTDKLHTFHNLSGDLPPGSGADASLIGPTAAR